MYPENTILSFIHSSQIPGMVGLETDVQVSLSMEVLSIRGTRYILSIMDVWGYDSVYRKLWIIYRYIDTRAFILWFSSTVKYILALD